MVDKKAKAAHEIWAHWMRYFFTQVDYTERGEFVISEDKMSRWERLMNTEFEDLTTDEKQSDYKIANLYLNF